MTTAVCQDGGWLGTETSPNTQDKPTPAPPLAHCFWGDIPSLSLDRRVDILVSIQSIPDMWFGCIYLRHELSCSEVRGS